MQDGICEIAFQPDAVDEGAHIIKRIIAHGIIIPQITFWRADIQLAEFHGFRMKAHGCFQLFYFKTGSLFGGYLYVPAECIVHKFYIPELAIDLAELKMRPVKIIVRCAIGLDIIFKGAIADGHVTDSE